MGGVFEEETILKQKILKYLRSMTFGMILLGLIVACSLAGSLIAQGKEVMWSVKTYPGWYGILLKLGLNNVFYSWYFLALVVLLCLNLTLCSLVRIRRVYRAAKNAVPNAAKGKTDIPLSPERLKELHSYLESRRFRKTEIGDALVNAGFNVVTSATSLIDDNGASMITETLNYWKTSHLK